MDALQQYLKQHSTKENTAKYLEKLILDFCNSLNLDNDVEFIAFISPSKEPSKNFYENPSFVTHEVNLQINCEKLCKKEGRNDLTDDEKNEFFKFFADYKNPFEKFLNEDENIVDTYCNEYKLDQVHCWVFFKYHISVEKNLI